MGVLGPVAFTVAWIAGSLRQTGRPVAAVQLSGLAAPDARDPWLMIGGFVLLGACMVGFGRALHRALDGRRGAGRTPRGPGPAPRLVQLCGAATAGAGLLRRDRMALAPAGLVAHESLHNHAHDAVSAFVYVALVAAILLLARRFRGDRHWAVLRGPVLVTGAVTGVLLVVFALRVVEPWNGVVQRVAVSLPLAGTVAVAVRLFGAVPD